MPKKIKLTRKQIKKPDEFLTFSEKVWNWAEEHIWTIVGVIAVIVVGLFALRLVSSWYEISQDAPRRTLAQAEEVFNASVGEGQDQLTMAMMGNQKPEYDTYHEKYEKAIESFQKVVSTYPDTTEAQLANLYLGVSHEQLGNYREALDFYNKFLGTPAADKNEVLHDSARMGIARSHFEKKDYKESLNYLEKLAKENSSYKNDALLLMARCYHQQGKEDKVAEVLDKIEQKDTTARIAQTAPYLQAYWKKKEKGEITVPEESAEPSFQPVMEMEGDEVKEATELPSGTMDKSGKKGADKETEKDEKKPGSMISIPSERVGEDSSEEGGGLRLPTEDFAGEGSSEERAPLLPAE